MFTVGFQTVDVFISNIVVGIVSGLVTALLIYLFVFVWKTVIVPAYERRIYRGHSLLGSWVLSDNEGNWEQTEVLEISQTADRLSGRQILTPKQDVILPPRTLILTGIIRDRFVTMTFESPDRKRVGYGCFIGEIIADGDRLSGYASYYDILRNSIQSKKVTYKRI